MGGGAFLDSMIIWLTLLPILAFAILMVIVRFAFRAAGKKIGWGQAALFVLGAFIALQLLLVVVEKLFF